MRKRKDEPRAGDGTEGLTPEELEKMIPALADLAAQLAALGHDPVSYLRAVVGAQHVAHGRDAIAALSLDARTILAPSVAVAIASAGLSCQHPAFGSRYRRRLSGDPALYPDRLAVEKDKAAQRTIKAASAALLKPNDLNLARAERELRVTEALVLAHEVDAEADRISEARSLEIPPMSLALRLVARAHGTSPEALRKRIERARKQCPAAGWPKKKARRL